MTPRVPAAEVPLGGDDERLLLEAAPADPRPFAELYERHFDLHVNDVDAGTGGRSRPGPCPWRRRRSSPTASAPPLRNPFDNQWYLAAPAAWAARPSRRERRS